MDEIIDILKELQRLIEVKFYSVKTDFGPTETDFGPADYLRLTLGDIQIMTIRITNDAHIMLIHQGFNQSKIRFFLSSPDFLKEKKRDNYDVVSLCDPRAFEKALDIVAQRVMEGVGQ